MTYQPIPIKEEAWQKKAVTKSDTQEELLKRILIQLQIMNMHLEKITDEKIGEEDITCI